MTQYEYKVLPAPERGERIKGLKTTSDRFAHALAGELNAAAREGWEYLRAETLPCTERTRILRRPRNSEQHVLVFRRPRRDASASVPAGEDGPAPVPLAVARAPARDRAPPPLSATRTAPRDDDPPAG